VLDCHQAQYNYIFNQTMQSLCVYCGSSPGADAAYIKLATQTGELLAKRNITLVYGGGARGLMGAVAQGCIAAGGRVIGIIPQLLVDKELAYEPLKLAPHELHIVPDMHTRKRMMAEKSDGFLTLPGGLGTFEELFEMWAWRQLGYHDKPLGVLNINGYYDGLLQFLNTSVKQGFVRGNQLDYLRHGAQLEPLLATLSDDYQASSHAKVTLDMA
jgi:uncharacterized protein (TIGR00730 family)